MTTTTGHGDKLSRKQEQAIAALLEQPSIVAAAGVVGVSECTLRNWVKLPAFRRAYRAACRDILERSMGRVQHATGAAFDTLLRLLTCGSHGVEARAAEAILNFATRAAEMGDVAERLEAIEQALEERRREDPA